MQSTSARLSSTNLLISSDPLGMVHPTFKPDTTCGTDRSHTSSEPEQSSASPQEFLGVEAAALELAAGDGEVSVIKNPHVPLP